MAANPSALIVGAGKGLSGSLGRLLESGGFNVALAARNPD
jgi:short-subunit dehydrogenase